MATLTVRLFGKFDVQRGGTKLEGLHAGKMQELFCYLLLQRERPHPREVLADMLWGECTTTQSKKYLRQVLWQLQAALQSGTPPGSGGVLIADREYVCVHSQSDLWVDVAVFESASARAQEMPGGRLDEHQAQLLKGAVELYRGDLLDGWYKDWCLFERERLQKLYLRMLDKLMCYSELHQQYEAGLVFGERALRLDRAHERTHQRMMRLQHLAGDRAGALRQYQRCVAALREELGVSPADCTVQLFEQVRADRVEATTSLASLREPVGLAGDRSASAEDDSAPMALAEALPRLRRLRLLLSEMDRQFQKEVRAVEQVLPESSQRNPAPKSGAIRK